MIKFHYHSAPRDIPRIDVRKGDPMCHVYSDASLEELLAWGRARGLGPARVHHTALPHFDAFGAYLEGCGPGVGRRELVADIRAWRERAGRPSPSRQ
jgi:hypothetical protein